MNAIQIYIRYTLLVAFLFVNTATRYIESPAEIVFVGSTPGDPLIKTLLTINPDKTVDFIRWDLTLRKGDNNENTFTLNLLYGESQPNTSGFKGGGEKKSLNGKYIVLKTNDRNIKGDIYQLESENELATKFSIIELNENLFHLLTPDYELMVGNGGWSYTLNRIDPEAIPASVIPALTNSSAMINDTARQTIFEGRTPCMEISTENNFNVVAGCFKLKWKLTLFRDSKTYLPTMYTINRTNSRDKLIQGKWTIIKGTDSYPFVTIYQLDPDIPEKSISLLAGDKNVLFFLNKKNQLFTGNRDFSYTLNRRLQN